MKQRHFKYTQRKGDILFFKSFKAQKVPNCRYNRIMQLGQICMETFHFSDLLTDNS